ncbi:MAG: O-antigen polymerase [Oculatellaceae cyanobacterium bins.114]|nr:O-antigen polymerase [Oculatellaceae cyanobacterium bins.114]
MVWSNYKPESPPENLYNPYGLHHSHLTTRVYFPPTPTLSGTACLLMGIILAYMLYPSGETPSEMARVTAIAIGIAFLASVFFDGRKGLYNLFRTDLLCLIGIYGLTLAEFLFPQDDFNRIVEVMGTAHALDAVLLGITGLTLGRHLVTTKPIRSDRINLEISNATLFRTIVVCAFMGYLYMLISVQFNPLALIDGMLGPRFSEPWTRGRLGSWSSLLTELNLLCYAIPPLTGVIWNRRQFFSRVQILIVLAIFALVMFQGFSSGTRNIFIAYVATFLMGYLLTLRVNNFRNTILPILVAVFISLFASYHMLEFRTMGLRNYIVNQVYAGDTVRQTLAVDYNLVSLAPVIDAFPDKHPFLGFEIISWALIKPVPRAFWPGKPEGLSVSIEELTGAKGWTVATTYLGESYMMAGWLGVIGMSLLFGALAAWWNRMAIQGQSDYSLVVYALGFFAAGITMRSMFWLTTAILPVIALLVFRKFGFGR